MTAAFVIWSLTALIFLVFGILARRSKTAVGFFANVKPPKVRDVQGYNRAVSRIWFVFALIFELLGLPLLLARQDSPLFFFLGLGVVFLVIGTVLAYVLTQNKYV